MEKINIAELLKDCPKGMELDCTMYNYVTLIHVLDGNAYPIKIKTPVGQLSLDKYGQYFNHDFAKCVIFPKGKTTWEGFVPPVEFKDGDIVATNSDLQVFILQKAESNTKGYCYIGYDFKFNEFFDAGVWEFERLATEEEKQKLFQAVKDNGYRWNEETKTLEKLIEPKFKVGNKIKEINSNEDVVLITNITDDYYIVETEYCMKVAISMNMQNNYELVPNKFDITTLVPFESKVLVRESKTDAWEPAFYGFFHQRYKRFYTTSSTWLMCIPYNEDTKHLIDTTNDCNEFYKTWEERA